MIKRTVVPETNLGLYVWETADGQIVGNEDGDILNIPARYGDVTRIGQLRKAVQSLGIHGGKPVFWPGRRRVSQSEYEDQMERVLEGKIGDPFDRGNREGDV